MFQKVRSARVFAIIMALILTTAGVALAGAPPAPYFNGFEVDTNDWTSTTRVATGTGGIASATGDWHAEATSGAFTRWDGYSSVFPDDGYTTSIDIYLDVAGGDANDTRFDFSSAINTPAGTHRRDFVFNVGFYNDSDATGSGPRFVISASNNAGRANSFPKNPARDPFAITTSGWYTFKHEFRDNGSGVLAVDLSIADAAGTVLHTWTLSDPSDVIGATVGGNRYGWFVSIEDSSLAIDNASRSGAVPKTVDDCKKGGWQSVFRADGTPFKNQGDCIQYVNTGK